MNDIKKAILEKIKGGEIKMIPQWHFVLRSVLWATGSVITALVTIYLLSFILFALHRTGVIFAPLFGWHGVVLFVVASPWILILILLIFLAVLYLLVSHYAFSYKKPLVYSLVGVVLLVIAIASLIQQTVVHERIHTFATDRHVPGLTPFYRQFETQKQEAITLGEITELTERGFTLTTESGVFSVSVTEKTRLPRNRELSIGDTVMVFGSRSDETIEAFGVRPDDLPPQRQQHHQQNRLQPR